MTQPEYGFRAPADRARLPTYLAVLASRYRFVELWAPSPFLTQDAALARSFGLFVTTHAGFHDLTLGAADEALRRFCIDAITANLRASAEAGARLMVCHAGQLPWTDYPDPSLSPEHADLRREEQRLREAFLHRAVDAVAELAEAAAGLGLGLALENLPQPNELPRTPAEMRRFLPTGTGFCIDAGHARLAGHHVEEFLAAVEGRALHLHLHTNDGQYDLHWPPQEPAPAGFSGSALIELIRGGPEDYLAVPFMAGESTPKP